MATDLTVYVDPALKGAGIRHEDGAYAPGCWVGLIATDHDDGRRVRRLHLTEAVTRDDAIKVVRAEAGVGSRRKVTFEPTSPAERAWHATVKDVK